MLSGATRAEAEGTDVAIALCGPEGALSGDGQQVEATVEEGEGHFVAAVARGPTAVASVQVSVHYDAGP